MFYHLLISFQLKQSQKIFFLPLLYFSPLAFIYFTFIVSLRIILSDSFIVNISKDKYYKILVFWFFVITKIENIFYTI